MEKFVNRKIELAISELNEAYYELKDNLGKFGDDFLRRCIRMKMKEIKDIIEQLNDAAI